MVDKTSCGVSPQVTASLSRVGTVRERAFFSIARLDREKRSVNATRKMADDGSRGAASSPLQQQSVQIGESEPRLRRGNDVERVGRIATVTRRIGKPQNDLEHLEERTSPALVTTIGIGFGPRPRS